MKPATQNIKTNRSYVSGYTFPYLFSNNETFLKQNRAGVVAKLRFNIKVMLATRAAEARLKTTLRLKKCYYGPFKGEFGHFLAHTLPFLMYLHKHGVQISYCGMELHKPFMVDETGKSIIAEFHPLRDFFAETPPHSNSVTPPADVQQSIDAFTKKAVASGAPFWNIGDNFYYWFVHRHWLGRGYTYLYDLSRVYKTRDEKAVCIFPRKKGAASSHNNGEFWDYDSLIKSISPYVDKVYVVGHPSQSLAIKSQGNIDVRIASDNRVILECCANARLIITQHSGVNNLGEYLKKQVLIIYKGGKTVSDIGSMNNTMLFRQYMNERIPLQFAFSENEVIDFVQRTVAK